MQIHGFLKIIDLPQLWGHQNDVTGYGQTIQGNSVLIAGHPQGFRSTLQNDQRNTWQKKHFLSKRK